MRQHLHRPSPAMVVALCALFVAMGGTGYAAATGAIDSREIKNNSVQGKDVGNSSLTGKDVKNKSLTPIDFKGSVKGATGATGATGAAGAPGAQGAPGTARAYATVDNNGVVIASKSKGITQANIDPDTVVGLVCLTGLPFTPKSAMVAAQAAFDGGEQDVVATSFVADGNVNSGDCSGALLVRTFDISSAALVNRPFHIWLEG